MKLNNSVLTVNIILQDKFRKWFSSVGLENQIKAGTVILGDSDIDYSLAPNISSSRVLSAPYGNVGIKHKLIYNGVGKDLSGTIKSLVRKIKTDGSIQSLYQYNLNENWIDGTSIPILSNSKDWEILTFEDTKMGYIIFFETVLDFYLDPNGNKKRLVENYNFSDNTVKWNGSSIIPNGWEYIFDKANNSMYIGKINTESNPISLEYNGSISLIGEFSKKIKTIKFNY